MLKLVGRDNPILRKAAPRFDFSRVSTRELAFFVHEMFSVCYANDGLGLAANQIGSGFRVFVIACGKQVSSKLSFGIQSWGEYVVVNPSWKPSALHGNKMETQKEGCLSLPGELVPVERHYAINVTYSDMYGNVQHEHMEGLKARIFQHEFDHLQGVLITDRCVESGAPSKSRNH